MQALFSTLQACHWQRQKDREPALLFVLKFLQLGNNG